MDPALAVVVSLGLALAIIGACFGLVAFGRSIGHGELDDTVSSLRLDVARLDALTVELRAKLVDAERVALERARAGQVDADASDADRSAVEHARAAPGTDARAAARAAIDRLLPRSAPGDGGGSAGAAPAIPGAAHASPVGVVDPRTG